MSMDAAKGIFSQRIITYAKSEGLKINLSLKDYLIIWVTLTMPTNYEFVKFLISLIG
jgi:hypothetical protein